MFVELSQALAKKKATEEQYKALSDILWNGMQDAKSTGNTCGVCCRLLNGSEMVVLCDFGRFTMVRKAGRTHEIFFRAAIKAPVCLSCFESPDTPLFVVVSAYGRRDDESVEAICESCGRPFAYAGNPERPHQYCCERCKDHFNYLTRRGPRRRPLLRCQICRGWFSPKRPDAKYCKPACMQKAYRIRLKEACDTLRTNPA